MITKILFFPPLCSIFILINTLLVSAATINTRSENIYNTQVVSKETTVDDSSDLVTISLLAPTGFHTKGDIKVKNDTDLEMDNPELRNVYSVTVVDGSGTGSYKYETNVTCTQKCPTDSVTETTWSGATSEVNGNIKYHRIMTNTFDKWSNNNTNKTITYKVPAYNSTIKALYSRHETGRTGHMKYDLVPVTKYVRVTGYGETTYWRDRGGTETKYAMYSKCDCGKECEKAKYWDEKCEGRRYHKNNKPYSVGATIGSHVVNEGGWVNYTP